MNGVKTLPHGQNNLNNMELTSKKVNVKASDSFIFNMLINCNNIEKYIPNDKIQNWQSAQDHCSFSVEGVGKIEMSLQEKMPFNSVSYSVGNSIVKSAFIIFSINKIEGKEDVCDFVATANLDVPFFMAQMVKPSLQRFLDMLVDYIKTAAEKAFIS